jgi:hypothetical protein
VFKRTFKIGPSFEPKERTGGICSRGVSASNGRAGGKEFVKRYSFSCPLDSVFAPLSNELSRSDGSFHGTQEGKVLEKC